MPSSYFYKEPQWVQDTLKADRDRKLSTKDRKSLTAKRAAVSMNPIEQAANLRVELQPYNIASIEQELSRATDPAIISILKEEQNNILSLVNAASKIKESQQQQAPEPSFLDHISNLLQNLFTVRK